MSKPRSALHLPKPQQVRSVASPRVPVVCLTSEVSLWHVKSVRSERGRRTWLVRVYNGRDRETKKRKYLNQTIRGELRDAQAHLNKMLGEAR